MDLDPKIQLYVERQMKEHREQSDKDYAKKIVETIVFGGIAIVASVVLYSVLAKIGLNP